MFIKKQHSKINELTDIYFSNTAFEAEMGYKHDKQIFAT
jgi:hypothetical protein